VQSFFLRLFLSERLAVFLFTLARSPYAVVAAGLSLSDIDADAYQLHFLRANHIDQQ
jgi:hypothetical protein